VGARSPVRPALKGSGRVRERGAALLVLGLASYALPLCRARRAPQAYPHLKEQEARGHLGSCESWGWWVEAIIGVCASRPGPFWGTPPLACRPPSIGLREAGAPFSQASSGPSGAARWLRPARPSAALTPPPHPDPPPPHPDPPPPSP
jgi:hypothetical protein